jgi:hypothetical protein
MPGHTINRYDRVSDIPTYPNAAGLGYVGSRAFIEGVPVSRDVAKGTIWFVDAANGLDTNDGKSWNNAFLTMSKAFTSLVSGDIIVFSGKVREQLTTPVQIFDITIIGAGNRPRHADSAPANGDYASNTWTTPTSPTAATPLCKVLQQGWRFENVLFAGPTDAACVLLFRDGGSGNDERDASHAEFYNCRFASGQDGIEDSGGCGHVGIYDSYFTDLTGVALKQTVGAGIGQPYFRWDVQYNRFQDCPSLTTAKAAQFFRFMFNTVSFASAPTLGFDFTGGKQNQIVRNVFNVLAADFDPDGGFTGTATDNWSNTLEDAIETGLPAN